MPKKEFLGKSKGLFFKKNFEEKFLNSVKKKFPRNFIQKISQVLSPEKISFLFKKKILSSQKEYKCCRTKNLSIIGYFPKLKSLFIKKSQKQSWKYRILFKAKKLSIYFNHYKKINWRMKKITKWKNFEEICKKNLHFYIHETKEENQIVEFLPNTHS